MNIEVLEDLKAKIDAATGPGRELDLAIAVALGDMTKEHADLWLAHITGDLDPCLRPVPPSRYTASIDAAVALAERVMKCTKDGEVVYELRLSGSLNDPSKYWPAALLRWYPEGYSGSNWHSEIKAAATPALAIVSALVSALIAKHGGA